METTDMMDYRNKFSVRTLKQLMLLGVAIASLAIPAGAQSTRDPWLWPFASNSIWNMPIGSGAVYSPTNMNMVTSASYADLDVEMFNRSSAADPVQNVGNSHNCTQTSVDGTLHIANNVVWICDSGNHCMSNLEPDGQTIHQYNYFYRPTTGSTCLGLIYPDANIYTDGIQGGHGGSGLACFGGSIRQGELLSSQIRHVLKIEFRGTKYSNQGGGYHWPAYKADSCYSTCYSGSNPLINMGTLLAIPPTVTPSSIGISDATGLLLFHALQDYGAYIVDDTAVDSVSLCCQQETYNDFVTLGLTPWSTTGLFHDDMIKLANVLAVVSNNSPTSIGGGGTPRQPLAPPIGSAAPSSPTGVTATAGNTQVTLSWSASSGATSYNVYRGTVSRGEGLTPISTVSTGISYSDTAVVNGSTYYYTVTAVNANGESPQSAEVSATPNVAVLPSSPTGVTATAASSNQINLAWTNTASNATGIHVYRATDNVNFTQVTSVAATATKYSDTGLSRSTTYYYKLAAYNGSGSSPYSNTASAGTPKH